MAAVDDSSQGEPSTNPSESDRVSEKLAQGISCMLGSVIRSFDLSAENTVRSQDQLLLSLHRLTTELDQLLEDAPLPFIMQHAAKISSVRKRVSSLNLLLKSIQCRIDKIDEMLSTSLSHVMQSWSS
ncbi:hypothetical protein Sjap_002704 [Stephania japonica]|uniref:Biogenesis of lysosome-related organelles complex 1 subunit 7 n=1 Tax=Stephania japonica TaxID=461633 RepID=A0AAP0KP43_9MAGN